MLNVYCKFVTGIHRLCKWNNFKTLYIYVFVKLRYSLSGKCVIDWFKRIFYHGFFYNQNARWGLLKFQKQCLLCFALKPLIYCWLITIHCVVSCRWHWGPGQHARVLGEQVGGLLGQVRPRLPAVWQQCRRALQRHHTTAAYTQRRVRTHDCPKAFQLLCFENFYRKTM